MLLPPPEDLDAFRRSVRPNDPGIGILDIRSGQLYLAVASALPDGDHASLAEIAIGPAVQQAIKLSPADRSAIEVSLARMVGDAFGALATLPLFCTGQLPSPNPAAAILEHFDVWRSCLVVVREVLKSAGFGAAEMPDALHELMDQVATIRDAYGEIHSHHKTNRRHALLAFERLRENYGSLAESVRELGIGLEIDTTFLPGDRSLKKTSHDRSLRWLGEQLAGESKDAEG